jgi:hypothetical protein
MTLKTLLLGSATAFAVVGGAQAADLSIAEPVDYVRICDAFGSGYYYIPGTDTCLKIGGSVKFIAKFAANGVTYGAAPDTHSSNWWFTTEAVLEATAKSMTEYGELGANFKLKGVYNPNGLPAPAIPGVVAANGNVALDGASLWWGPFKFGHFSSAFDGGGGFADSVYRSDVSPEQIQISFAAAGFGLALGIEDPRTRWGTALPVNYSMPDIVAAATISQGMWDAKVSAGFAQLAIGSVYGVAGNLTVKLSSLGTGTQIRVGGAFGTGSSFVGGGTNGANNWSAYITGQTSLSSTIAIAASYGYLFNGGNGLGSWQGGAHLVWTPVPGFEGKIKAQYVVTNGVQPGVWTGEASVKRSF